MGSTKQEQAARRAAIQETISENREFFEGRMRHHYEAMGLGEWTPRLSPEERAERKAFDERTKAAEKIQALAAKAGLTVTVDQAAATDWRGDENGFADEQPESTADRIARIAQEAEDAEALTE